MNALWLRRFQAILSSLSVGGGPTTTERQEALRLLLMYEAVEKASAEYFRELRSGSELHPAGESVALQLGEIAPESPADIVPPER